MITKSRYTRELAVILYVSALTAPTTAHTVTDTELFCQARNLALQIAKDTVTRNNTNFHNLTTI